MSFNYLTVLRYAICVHMLSHSLFIKISVRAEGVERKCIYNVKSTIMLNITCPKETDRIEVVSMNYRYLDVFPSLCTAVTSPCNKNMRTGLELSKQSMYYYCSQAKKGCRGRVGELPQPPQDGCPGIVSFNLFLMEYDCIPETDFIDFCGDVDVNIRSTVKHLAYFRKYLDNRFQDCRCSIQGPHTLTAVNADIPSSAKNECKPANIWINAVYTNLSESNTIISQPEEQLINVEFNGLQSSYIRMIRNCISYAKVWFKIKPAEGKAVRIQCGKSINIPSSASSPKPSSPTTTTIVSTSEGTQQQTTEVTNHNTNSLVATTSLPNTTEKSQSPQTADQVTSTSTITSTVATTSLSNTTEKSQLSLSTDQMTSTSTIISTMETTSLSNTTEKSQSPLSTDQMTSTSTIISTMETTSLSNTTEKSQSPQTADQMTSTSAITSTVAGTSTTDHEQNTLPPTEKNTKVPAIVGSVVGSLAVIVILIIGVLVYRRNQNLSRRRDSAKRTNGADEYDDACEMRITSYISVSNDSESDQRHENDAREARIPSYISLITDPDRDLHHDGTVDNEGNYANEYEVMDINNGQHAHEYENASNDTNQHYSTPDQNLDHSGNYEKLNLYIEMASPLEGVSANCITE